MPIQAQPWAPSPLCGYIGLGQRDLHNRGRDTRSLLTAAAAAAAITAAAKAAAAVIATTAAAVCTATRCGLVAAALLSRRQWTPVGKQRKLG